MTQKTYKTAMGKTVDLGALILKNETARAVGNMKVNARGDVLNETNTVIDKKTNQVQRQYSRQSNVTNGPVYNNNIEARKARQAKLDAKAAVTAQPPVVEQPTIVEPVIAPPIQPIPEVVAPVVDIVPQPELTGLAAAIARAQENNTEE